MKLLHRLACLVGLHELPKGRDYKGKTVQELLAPFLYECQCCHRTVLSL